MGGAEFLKQSEIFAFLAALFLIAIVLPDSESGREQGAREDPPIIRMSEEKASFRFELGSAEVSPQYRQAIETIIVPQLEVSLRECGNCDAIEVVGHTDGVHVSKRYSQLDEKVAVSFASGKVEGVLPGSNIDLGMLRALAILKILRESRDEGRLKGVTYFFPYSAGQMILLDESLAKDDVGKDERERRRIEIRLLRSSQRKVEEAGGGRPAR